MAGDTPQNFKKRVFSGTSASSSSSSSSMEPELVESVPPTVCTSKAQVILHEVIDIDRDYDSADIMVADEKFSTINKEKVIKDLFDGSGNHDAKDASPGSDTLIDDILYYDDEDIYLNTDDIMDVDQQHSSLQAYFDHLKTPPGVEATVPWFPEHYQINKKPATASTSSYTNSQMQWDAVGLIDELDQYASSSSSKHPQFNVKPTSASSSSLPTQLNASSQAPEVKLSSPWPLPQASQSRNKSFAPQHRGSVLNIPFGVESSMNHPLGVPSPLGGHFHRGSVVNTPFGVESSANHSLGVLPPSWGHFQDGGKNTSYSFNSNIPAQAGSVNHPPGFEPPMSWGQMQSNHKMKPFFNPAHVKSSFYSSVSKAAYIPSKEEADIFWANATGGQTSIAAAGSSKSPFELISSSEVNRIGNDIMRKFELFKQFDTVQDYSDHHYSYNGSSMGQPSKNCAKRIQEEWKILEMDLPDTIFVRVYEERMEFLRAVIVGAVGTPYHDGLFFFDFFFPCGYPNEPPHVYYHSGGLRLNPNLYGNGKVCLSLLNTWHGDKNEMWIPGKSTMLQVLVSIQGLILNQEPFFNEPGMAYMSGSQHGEIMSRQYNEDTFILSLRTMSYTMRRPPKHFEDFVRGHFCKRAHSILTACKGYMNGAQVGRLVEGGVQNVEVGDKSCSQNFKKTLADYVNMLVVDFTNMGAEHCEKFLSPEKKGNKPEPVIRSS